MATFNTESTPSIPWQAMSTVLMEFVEFFYLSFFLYTSFISLLWACRAARLAHHHDQLMSAVGHQISTVN